MPEAATPTIKGRTNYWRRHNMEYLRVTAIEEADTFVIITVTPKEKGPEAEQ